MKDKQARGAKSMFRLWVRLFKSSQDGVVPRSRLPWPWPRDPQASFSIVPRYPPASRWCLAFVRHLQLPPRFFPDLFHPSHSLQLGPLPRQQPSPSLDSPLSHPARVQPRPRARGEDDSILPGRSVPGEPDSTYRRGESCTAVVGIGKRECEWERVDALTFVPRLWHGIWECEWGEQDLRD